MSFDDFIQEASFTNLNWNGSSGDLRVRAGGEQNELKLPQTFVVDPKNRSVRLASMGSTTRR